LILAQAKKFIDQINVEINYWFFWMPLSLFVYIVIKTIKIYRNGLNTNSANRDYTYPL
jgi:hypothetical protein